MGGPRLLDAEELRRDASAGQGLFGARRHGDGRSRGAEIGAAGPVGFDGRRPRALRRSWAFDHADFHKIGGALHGAGFTLAVARGRGRGSCIVGARLSALSWSRPPRHRRGVGSGVALARPRPSDLIGRRASNAGS